MLKLLRIDVYKRHIYNSVMCGILRYHNVGGEFAFIMMNNEALKIFGYETEEECLKLGREEFLNRVYYEEMCIRDRLRTDSLMFLGLRIAQFVSLGLILAGIIGIYVIRKKHKIKDKDDDILENLKSENNRIEDIDNNEENIIKDNIDIKN